MGRKRLLTILTTVVLAVGVPAGTASAQLQLPGVGSVDVSEDCAGADVSLGDLELDAKLCASDDGAADEPEAGSTGTPLDQVTDPVRDATRAVTDRVNEMISGSQGDGATPTPPSAPGGDGGTAPSGGSDSGSTDRGSRGGSEVQPAGTADRAPTAADQRERQRQLASIRALRSDLSAGTNLDTRSGPVVPFGGISSLQIDEPADPLVAEGSIVPGIDSTVTPDVAPSAEQAIFAGGPAAPDLDEVPLSLQLLAGALVLGAGAVWTLARREFGDQPITTA
ncbi:MAG: hypothetical protein WEB03_01500 [Nitriliruptor sp.]|uniref:hypothetical protein n=1 Tax=Nitriliruptor sp. TaxID=2448056 RepID=UPI0034A06B91